MSAFDIGTDVPIHGRHIRFLTHSGHSNFGNWCLRPSDPRMLCEVGGGACKHTLMMAAANHRASV